MNFACDSLKPKAKLRNEDFYFHIETPRGHFFAVLDFASHDYANLNATLKGKLETIVASFASLEDFSDELFLGFLAKEINNFVSNLADQSGGPELFFSAALCLVNDDNLAYFLSGNVTIAILNDEGLTPLLQGDATPVQLGARNLDVPLRDGIDRFTLHDEDLVLITTQGLADVLPTAVTSLGELEPKSICDSLMSAGAAAGEDRTAVVISGPYVRRPGATFADSGALAEIKMSLASLSARLDALTANQSLRNSESGRLEGDDTARVEERLDHEIQSLKGDLGGKAATIDLLELDEKVRVLAASISGKADTADVLGLQRDVLKLGLSAPTIPAEANVTETETVPTEATVAESTVEPVSIPTSYSPAQKSFTLRAAIIVLVASLLGGFAGGWLHARAVKKAPEAWSVTTSGNQIVIGRLEGSSSESVTMNVAEPLKATGVQTFSSFADVKRYIETVSSSAAAPAQTSQGTQQASPSTDKGSENLSEITIKPGDSLKRLAQKYNVPPERLMELNPTITRWPSVRIGQKIFVPAAAPAAATTPQPQPTASPANPAAASTTQVTVGPGDSLNELARRFNTTAGKLKELNPQMNWPRIQTGQKVIVPAPGPLGG